MAINLKQPLSFGKQLERLKAHGLIIEDGDKAIDVLKTTNYYRLTGYALQFRSNESSDTYIDGVTFDVVHNCCLFDQELRSLLRDYLEIIEVYFRTQIAYHFSMIKCSKPPHDQHYYSNNFYKKEEHAALMARMAKNNRSYYKDSLMLKHHNKKYNGKMPLWVAVEFMSFSDLSKLYSMMYNSDKDQIATCMGIDFRVLENHLHCLSVLRNKCAHAARLYNTLCYPPARFSRGFLQKNKNIDNRSIFAYILVLIKRLPNRATQIELIDGIRDIIEKYDKYIDMKCIGFPANYLDLISSELK